MAQPIDEVRGSGLRKAFPPHGVVGRVEGDVGEDGALPRRGERVGVGMVVGAGRDAEEAVLGVDRPKPTVLADADPGDVVAHRLDLIAELLIVLGGDEHGKVGLAAGGGECSRHILLGAVGIGDAQNEHVLCHPAFLSAEIGCDAEREALLAEEHVAAVTGVDGDDGIVFGEVHDIALLGVDIALCVEALHKVAVLAECFKAVEPDARHDAHIEDDVDGVGDLDADAGEGGADDAHRIGDDVHRSALHLAARDLAEHGISFLGVHPIVGGACVLFVAAADERARFDAGDVIFRRAVVVAAGEFLLVEAEHFARAASFFAKGVDLSLAAVDPDDLIGLSELGAVLHKVKYLLIFGVTLRHNDLRVNCFL